MPERRWLASGVALAAGLLGAVDVVLVALNGTGYYPGSVPIAVQLALDVVVVASLLVTGWFLALRLPRNPIGWLLLAAGAVSTLSGAAGGWAYRGLVVAPETLPGATVAAWLFGWLWTVPLVLLGTFAILLFPDGHLPSPRWKPVAWMSGAVLVALAGSGALYPRLLHDQGMGVEPDNPLGLMSAAAPLLSGVVAGGLLVLGALMVASVVSLVMRFRRAAAVERDQIRLVVVTIVLVAALQLPPDPWDVTFAAVALVPVAISVATLRRDLWDLGVVVRKTVVLAVLTALITGLYLLAVVAAGYRAGGGGASLMPVLVTTVLVALGLQPVRLRLERAADRLVFGRRATPYEALATLSRRLRDLPSSADVPAHMAEVAATSVGARSARVRVDLPDGDPLQVVWPNNAGHDDPVVRLDVIHEGRPVGELSVVCAPGSELRPVEQRLIADLAAQAGPALATVRLTADLHRHVALLQAQATELRHSRQRLVAAQVEERRRLERQLHDGVQAHLLGVLIRLGRAIEHAEGSPWGDELRAAAALGQRTLDELRALSRGVHPSILSDRGVTAALRSYADAVAFPFRLEIRGDGRWEPDVEAILYFTCLEAVQNAVKHAAPQRLVVSLAQVDTTVEFTVADDGRGYDTAATRDLLGGLQQARDRLVAVGGTLTVRSTPGAGTVVSGTLPLGHADSAVAASSTRLGEVEQDRADAMVHTRLLS